MAGVAIGGAALKEPNARRRDFCYYLILTGTARFLVEFIRINPPWILGLSNAQVASAISVFGGLILLLVLKRSSTTNS